MAMNNILHAHEAPFGLRTYGIFLHTHIQNLKTLHKDAQEYKSKYPLKKKKVEIRMIYELDDFGQLLLG